jgi:lysophospholipase L1-like esterase
MPREWERRDVFVDGRLVGFTWQGHLHAVDELDMRGTAPFPPRQPGIPRILAVGDSLTYGMGVGADQTWPSVLQQRLSQRRPVEVLNLGVCGYNSGDVVRVLRQHLTTLDPDLVVYGMCLNDFLPHGGQQQTIRWSLVPPLPEHVRYILVDATLTGRFVKQRLAAAWIALGLRNDFLDDILEDFAGRREWFAADVKAMNDLVTTRGLPPVVARVLDNMPETHSRRAEVTAIAERALADAGIRVIPTEAFQREHDGERMVVSPWEAHPGPAAQRLFAEEFAEAIEKRDLLDRAGSEPD